MMSSRRWRPKYADRSARIKSRKKTRKDNLNAMNANTRARCAYRGAQQLGAAPESFTPELIEIWHELLSCAPRDVLVHANRELIEATCRLIPNLRGGTIRARERAILLSCLERLRMTPATRCAEILA